VQLLHKGVSADQPLSCAPSVVAAVRELMGTSAPGVLGHNNTKQKIQVRGGGVEMVVVAHLPCMCSKQHAI
jgi:hypothetical protein